jgi:hypothetical protein
MCQSIVSLDTKTCADCARLFASPSQYARYRGVWICRDRVVCATRILAARTEQAEAAAVGGGR